MILNAATDDGFLFVCSNVDGSQINLPHVTKMKKTVRPML